MDYRLICSFIILFLLFSCMGWCIEVVLKYIQFHRFINRGFLIGPYCPIYGYGAVLVTILIGGIIARHGTIAETFLAGFIICGVLEYFTSWYMEKLFHARWWDYSQKPMNLNGRIWIGNLILFGLGSILIIWIIDPWFFALISKISSKTLYFLSVGFLIIFLTDNIVSHILMNLVKKEIDNGVGDNTEEISRQIHEILKDRQILMRRIHNAYPKLQARPFHMVLELKNAKAAYLKAKKQSRKIFHLLQSEKTKRISIPSELELRFKKALETQETAWKKFKKLEEKLSVHHKIL